MARQDITWQGQEIQAKPREGNASKTRQGIASQCMEKQERQGKAWQGKARKGKAMHGKARQGNGRQGMTRLGKARLGKQGMAW
jgi:hypothetical protein